MDAPRPTYEDHLHAQGLPVRPLYRCVPCGIVGAAFTMAAVTVDDGFPAGVNFACGTCILDAARQRAVAEAEAAPTVVDWSACRAQRDMLLMRSDWTQGLDSPLDEVTREAWRTYRQQLRDITDAADPEAVVWPDPPA